jgi:energy-coupling factor transporter ATP-binding protein EcfA2
MSRRAVRQMADGSAQSVIRITAIGLFGRYNYRIPANARDKADPRLIIFYGDNGSGKTTLLRLLHHIVSPGPGRGHKTAMTRIAFKEFDVSFTDGHSLCARRPHAGVGSFDLILKKKGRHVASARYVIDEERRIPVQGKYTDEQEQLSQAISEAIGLDSYLLSDQRDLHSDRLPPPRASGFIGSDLDAYNQEASLDIAVRTLRLNRHVEQNDQVRLAIDRATQWARTQVLFGTNIGSVNADTIYADVVRQLAKASGRADGTSNPEMTRDELHQTLRTLGERSRRQERFGISSFVRAEDISTIVDKVPEENLGIVVRVLEPYLNGNRARIDALDEISRLLSFFTDSLNTFLKDKRVDFDIRAGLRVLTEDSIELNPTALSSGERQLLVLLCNVLSARQRSSLFLVDEPELSLNIKWQRELVSTLLGCTDGSPIQLFLATHSVELITSYSKHVLPLKHSAEVPRVHPVTKKNSL